jgi:hypothetical protein
MWAWLFGDAKNRMMLLRDHISLYNVDAVMNNAHDTVHRVQRLESAWPAMFSRLTRWDPMVYFVCILQVTALKLKNTLHSNNKHLPPLRWGHRKVHHVLQVTVTYAFLGVTFWFWETLGANSENIIPQFCLESCVLSIHAKLGDLSYQLERYWENSSQMSWWLTDFYTASQMYIAALLVKYWQNKCEKNAICLPNHAGYGLCSKFSASWAFFRTLSGKSWHQFLNIFPI